MRVSLLIALLLVPLAAASIPESIMYTLQYEEIGRVVASGSSTHTEAETSFDMTLEMSWRIVTDQTLGPSMPGIWSRAGTGTTTLTANGTFSQSQDGIAGHDEGTCTLSISTTVPSSASIARMAGKLYVAPGENAHPYPRWDCEGAVGTQSRPFVGSSLDLAERARSGSLPGELATALGYAYDAKSWSAMDAETREDAVLDDGGLELEEREEQVVTFSKTLAPQTAPGDEVCPVVLGDQIHRAECVVTGSVRMVLRPADEDDAFAAAEGDAFAAEGEHEPPQATTPGPGLAVAFLATLIALALARR